MGDSLSYLDNLLPEDIPECIASFHVHRNLLTAAGSVKNKTKQKKKRKKKKKTLFFCYDANHKVENV